MFSKEKLRSALARTVRSEGVLARLQTEVPNASGQDCAAVAAAIDFALDRFWNELSAASGGMICSGPEAVSLVHSFLMLNVSEGKIEESEARFLFCQQFLECESEYGWNVRACAPGSIAKMLSLL
ncbi:unnamed protein product, partial [Amoebophrya sp. A25]|eukprot:GSA25T00016475001.1